RLSPLRRRLHQSVPPLGGTRQRARTGQPVTQRLGLLASPISEAFARVVTGHDAVDGGPALAVADQNEAGHGFLRHGSEGIGKVGYQSAINPDRDRTVGFPYEFE